MPYFAWNLCQKMPFYCVSHTCTAIQYISQFPQFLELYDLLTSLQVENVVLTYIHFLLLLKRQKMACVLIYAQKYVCKYIFAFL